MNTDSEKTVLSLKLVEPPMTEVNIDVTKLVMTLNIVEPPMVEVSVDVKNLVEVLKLVDTGGVEVNVVVNVERDIIFCEQIDGTIGTKDGPPAKHEARPGY